MTFDAWIHMLRIVLLVITALFSGLVLVVDFRKDNGKITRWGIVALFGIGFSLLLQVVLLNVETSKSTREAAAAAATLRTILDESTATSRRQQDAVERMEALQADMVASLRKQEKSLQLTETVNDKSNRISQTVDISLTKQKELLHETQRTTADITRLKFPITDMRVSFRASIPMSGISPSVDKALASYRTKILDRCRDDLELKLGEESGIDFCSYYENDHGNRVLSSVQFNLNGPLFPDEDADPIVWDILCTVGLRMKFYRQGTEANWRKRRPDLSVVLATPIQQWVGRNRYGVSLSINDVPMTVRTDGGHDIRLGYDVINDRLLFAARGIPLNPRDMDRTAKIFGLHDIAGSTLVIAWSRYDYADYESTYNLSGLLSKCVEIKQVEFYSDNGLGCIIWGDDMQRINERDGVIYRVKLPLKLDQN